MPEKGGSAGGRLGLAVYHWGRREQNRLLTHCLGPASEELLREGLAETFHFGRYDARGAHLYAVYGAAAAARQQVGGRLASALAGYLEASPSRVELTAAELAADHQSCQGRTLCAADQLAGFACNNSLVFFDHPERGYPLSAARPASGTDELWQGLSGLSAWSLRRLAALADDATPHLAAISMIHGVDRELGCNSDWAAGSWRYAAASLLHFLGEERFSDAATCLEVLPGWIGARNLETFGRIFDRLDREAPLFPALPRLVQLAQTEVDRERFSEFALLREFVHAGLAQLAIPIPLRSTLLVYGWLRRLRA